MTAVSTDLHQAVAIGVASLVFSGEDRIDLPQDAVVVFVGPNNAGKSSCLREISDHFMQGRALGPVIRQLGVRQDGTPDQFKAWLDANVPLRTSPSTGGALLHQGYQQWLNPHDLQAAWQHKTAAQYLGKTISVLADGNTRLTAANPTSPPELDSPPTHPLHALYWDDRLEARLSLEFKKAFGMDLVLQRIGGHQVPLLCGTAPKIEPGEDRASHSYLKKLSSLRRLDQQGDGMKAFVGCLLSAIDPRKFIVMLDEPEAFLHPPQARLLGNTLLRDAPPGRQLLIATHSGDILRGLLDGESVKLHIVRITRKGDKNFIRELSSEIVREVWSDPLLRYSQVLDGLFHERVVICEGDADCRFYDALLQEQFASPNESRRPDLMFVATGGKARIPMVASALTHIGVPTSVIADLDFLREKDQVQKTFEALGGSWAEIKDQWEATSKVFDGLSPALSTSQVRERVTRFLEGITTPTLGPDEAQRLQAELKSVSPWGQLKRAGLLAISSGTPLEMAKKLLARLRTQGLFLLENGELERFVPSLGGHGPDWVAKVLERNLGKDPELQAARKFVADVVAFEPP